MEHPLPYRISIIRYRGRLIPKNQDPAQKTRSYYL